MTKRVQGLINRRIAASFATPLRHSQGTNTSALDHDNLISWQDWQDDGEGWHYSEELDKLYEALGITSGNGEWYESAYCYDKSIDPKIVEAWVEFRDSELDKINPEDFLVDEDEQT
jgi:hypothetical protein